eukprot:TRINITY_DN8295_c0_g1_i1.p1 TRINITY_DN8295_c0_g1~~TRINITY_DN8295_c0_g1_i1.p1  ORF type:complete len:419 (+),score=59.84 TRINITY_DN8295_c0_g1_i1:49-1257(+)
MKQITSILRTTGLTPTPKAHDDEEITGTAEQIKEPVIWQSQDPRTFAWVDYPDECSRRIEAAVRAGHWTCVAIPAPFESDKPHFIAEVQAQADGTGTQCTESQKLVEFTRRTRPVRRVDLSQLVTNQAPALEVLLVNARPADELARRLSYGIRAAVVSPLALTVQSGLTTRDWIAMLPPVLTAPFQDGPALLAHCQHRLEYHRSRRTLPQVCANGDDTVILPLILHSLDTNLRFGLAQLVARERIPFDAAEQTALREYCWRVECALSALPKPSRAQDVFCGARAPVDRSLIETYAVGRRVVWPVPVSVATFGEQAPCFAWENQPREGALGDALFVIRNAWGFRDVSFFSLFPDDGECAYPPNTAVVVRAVLDAAGKAALAAQLNVPPQTLVATTVIVLQEDA